MSACQDACVSPPRAMASTISRHGEGPSYCFLKNCTYPEYPPAIANGMFDYYSAAVYTEAAPQPNPCDGIVDRDAVRRPASTARSGATLRARRTAASQAVTRGTRSSGRTRSRATRATRAKPVPPAPPPSCANMCQSDDDCSLPPAQGPLPLRHDQGTEAGVRGGVSRPRARIIRYHLILNTFKAVMGSQLRCRANFRQGQRGYGQLGIGESSGATATAR